jgi:AcrR family transcriptional regulator
MFQNEKIQTRVRGRPRLHSDEEMRRRILDAADGQFHDVGFAAAGVADIAKHAGVSTRTVYRLFRNKPDLLLGMLARRIERFLGAIEIDLGSGLSPRDGLIRILIAYGNLTLSPAGMRVAKLLYEESGAFPEIAATFHKRAILPSNAVLENWLIACRTRGLIKLENPGEASGMLCGMMIMEPQRKALFGCGQALNDAAIRARAEVCAGWFLNGVRVEPVSETPSPDLVRS